MANEEHFAILKQGVEAWNKWREEHLLILPKLSGADLRRANLRGAFLPGADLSKADLRWAHLSKATLMKVDLRWANLSRADLSEANLTGANVEGAILWSTTFGDVDLSAVKGLDKVTHQGPSTVGIDTIYKSKGKIPSLFERVRCP